MNDLFLLLNEALLNGSFLRCVWSNPRKKEGYQKHILKPILLKNTLSLQLTSTKNNQEFHQNLSVENCATHLAEMDLDFKQIQLYTTSQDYQLLINKKGQATIKKLPPSLKEVSLSHNRQKKYVLDTPSSRAFLQALGLMDHNFEVKASKYDKYKQINRYLEIVADCIPSLNQQKLRIVDFGCGKSYLTFALYHYLTEILNKEVEVIGLDLKKDVIHFCDDLAQRLNYKNLHFQVGDIGSYTTDQTIDMVISLHACNTATDAALSKAVHWHSKVILAVPCCHHEAYTQIQNDILNPALKHGILKERIAALLTDGLRAQLLEACGYQVQVIEFIDMAHTPKNILIKALLKKESPDKEAHMTAYNLLADSLNLNLSLKKMLGDNHDI